MERKETVGFVQLEWVCPNCAGRNLGTQKTCKNCGAPQPDNVQFQRAADEQIITDEKTAEIAQAGADIHCGFCGARNPATAIACSQCGGDLKEGKTRQAGQELQATPAMPKIIVCSNCGAENSGGERLCAQCGSPLPRAALVESARPAPVQAQIPAALAQADAQSKKTNWLLFGGIGAFLLICFAILFLFVFPSAALQGTVTNVRWQTSVPVEEIRAMDYSNKSGSPPSNAYNVSCNTENKEVCVDKTIDKGNGFGEVVKECRTESQQYCSYTLDEWKTMQTYTLEGTDLHPVYSEPTLVGSQRLGAQSETLTVYFDVSNGQKQYEPSTVSEFQQFTIGSVWTLKTNAFGGVLSVEKK
jgi:ribosomal protein L40E